MAFNPYEQEKYVAELRKVRKMYKGRLARGEKLTQEEQTIFLLVSCLAKQLC
jgi:hypothetical protein